MKNLLHLFRPGMSLALLVIAGTLMGQHTEKYRPQFHFSPNSGWIGDPDGLVKYNGLYHLFWWGHAYSSDQVHWTELPYPMQGNPAPYTVTTGSAVIDKNNISGFGTNSFLAFPTLDQPGDQRVGIASSTDLSNNFTDFNLSASNPIVGPAANAADFRDPQVFYYAPLNRWCMAVTRGSQSKIDFYYSTNLKAWTYCGSFGPDNTGTGAMWETPDIFELPVDGNAANKKWVLTIAVFPNKMKYFVGSFNGTSFTNLYPGQVFTLDYGMDFYAARTWRDYDAPQTRTTILGWMGNWNYSTIAPSKYTYRGLGAVSVPRDLALVTYPEGIRLTQNPVAALQSLRQTAVSFHNKLISGINPVTNYGAFSPAQNSYEIDATFNTAANADFGFNLCVNNATGKKVIVRYTVPTNTLSIDRNNASDVDINSSFPGVSSVVIPPVNNRIRLHLFVDKSSIEVFANDGKQVLTMLTYPGDNQTGIEVFSGSAADSLIDFTGWQLGSIWAPTEGYKIPSGGIFEIVNRSSGKVLDASGFANGTALQQWDRLNGINQQWKVQIVDSGYFSGSDWIPDYYTFTNQNNGKLMDLAGGATTDGGVIQQYSSFGNDNQKWSIEDAGGGYWTIISKNSSRARYHKVMEVEGASGVNGHQVQTWTFLGYPHQEWKFNLIGLPAMRAAATVAPPNHSAGTSFQVYPNPSRNGFTVSNAVASPAANRSLIYGITLESNTGRLIRHLKTLKGLASYSLDTRTLPAGLYVLSVYNGKTYEKHAIEIDL